MKTGSDFKCHLKSVFATIQKQNKKYSNMEQKRLVLSYGPIRKQTHSKFDPQNVKILEWVPNLDV